MPTLKVAFDPCRSRAGCALSRPDARATRRRLEWSAAAFPRRDRSTLDGADVGLFVQPPEDPGLPSLVVGVSRMVVVMAVGHHRPAHELRVADVLDEPFHDGEDLVRVEGLLDARRVPRRTADPTDGRRRAA